MYVVFGHVFGRVVKLRKQLTSIEKNPYLYYYHKRHESICNVNNNIDIL